MALIGDNEYPYAVPISYVYYDNKIYFHSALSGHKVDAIIQNNKISFCVVEEDNVVPEEFTTYFRSVIIFGKARVLDDDNEKRVALEKLGEKYSPNNALGLQHEIKKGINRLLMIEVVIESMTGKESIELVKKE